MILRPPDPPLSDGVVLLRRWREDDVDRLTSLISGDDSLPRWTTIPPAYTRQDARTFVRGTPDLWRDGDAAVFCIVSTAAGEGGGDGGDDAAVVGGIDLRMRPNDIGHAGYWVGRAHRGRGTAGRALRLVAAWGFTTLGLGRVELQVVVGNDPSERAATKVGFRREGVLRSSIVLHGERRDTTMFSLLPSDLGS